MEEEILPEDNLYFIDCNCDHPPESHDFMECLNCECKGHWEY